MKKVIKFQIKSIFLHNSAMFTNNVEFRWNLFFCYRKWISIRTYLNSILLQIECRLKFLFINRNKIDLRPNSRWKKTEIDWWRRKPLCWLKVFAIQLNYCWKFVAIKMRFAVNTIDRHTFTDVAHVWSFCVKLQFW